LDLPTPNFIGKLNYSEGKSQLTNDGRFQIDKDGTWDVLSSPSLTEEGVEGVIANSDGLVRGHLAIRLDPMLQTVEFPTGITDLNSGLSNVDRNTLTL
jgi:hypothetical protein